MVGERAVIMEFLRGSCLTLWQQSAEFNLSSSKGGPISQRVRTQSARSFDNGPHTRISIVSVCGVCVCASARFSVSCAAAAGRVPVSLPRVYPVFGCCQLPQKARNRPIERRPRQRTLIIHQCVVVSDDLSAIVPTSENNKKKKNEKKNCGWPSVAKQVRPFTEPRTPCLDLAVADWERAKKREKKKHENTKVCPTVEPRVSRTIITALSVDLNVRTRVLEALDISRLSRSYRQLCRCPS